MKAIQGTIDDNGLHHVDTGITTKEWITMLSDNTISPQQIENLLLFYHSKNHASTCKALEEKNGKDWHTYQRNITTLGKRVQERFGRFKVVPFNKKTKRDQTYWCIPMDGWETTDGFVWQVKPELCKALQEHLKNTNKYFPVNTLQPLIRWYINKETWKGDEEYKWKAFRQFNESFYSNEPIEYRIHKAFSRADNLLNSSNYYPLGMFKPVISRYPNLLDRLFDEKKPLQGRVEEYNKGFNAAVEEMAKTGYNDWNKKEKVTTYQDARAISVYLSMRYPATYYIYKYGIFSGFAKKLNYIIKNSDPTNRMLEFFELCKAVKVELLKEKEFIGEYKKWLTHNEYSDPAFNLLTQDFIYSVVRYMESYSPTSEVLMIEAKDVTETITKHTVPKDGKKIDYVKRDERNRSLGAEGELWVMDYEKERTKGKNVVHISEEEGDGTGYDILSYEDDGVTPRYIEVKTTTGGIDTPFFFSDNELQFSEENKQHYYVYRLYNFGKTTKLAIIHGSLADVNAQPVTYKCIVTQSTE